MVYFECDDGSKPQRIREFISAFATPYILQFFEDNFSLTVAHKELEISPCTKFHLSSSSLVSIHIQLDAPRTHSHAMNIYQLGEIERSLKSRGHSYAGHFGM